MNILNILQLICVFGTILTGGVALVWPRRIEGFTGLSAPGARGITEFRSVFGGVFIGLGFAVLILVISSAITFITALSISSIATNRRVEGGGEWNHQATT